MSTNSNRRRKQKEKKNGFLSFLFWFLIIFFVSTHIFLIVRKINQEYSSEEEAEVETELQETETTENETETGPVEQEDSLVTSVDLAESDIYTFLQGPKAWGSKALFSGSWCEEVLAGQKFSVFGCGHCCMANIYSTLTPYYCSPVDMFDLAREVTNYSPSSEYGAISWEFMQQALYTTGIESSLREKDETYEEFRQNIAGGITAIANVNSGDDDTYWQGVTGHYVNIWLYNSEDDTVFLADSGNPAHNRHRIPLRYVYDALKTDDSYQYMLVEGVDLEGNSWKHNGIDMDWTSPW